MKIINPWRWLRACWTRWFQRPVHTSQPFIRYHEVEELPGTLENNLLYVVGEGRHRWYAAMICPCGCGETLHMGLLEDTRPCWRVVQQSNGAATLSPSINRRVGCRAHFFLEHGKIRWCDTLA